jgi:hypothetical protein
MRKRLKKLTLNRETLRHLQAIQLGPVGGGGNTNEFNTGCACTDTCATDAGCGSASCGGTCAGCGSAAACTTGNTHEFLSGCATNC